MHVYVCVCVCVFLVGGFLFLLSNPIWLPGRRKPALRDQQCEKDTRRQAKICSLVHSEMCTGGFPGGAVVESLPANAGDTGSSLGLGGSHMPRSNWAREPQLLSLCVWSLCSTTGEAARVRGPRTTMKSGPRLPQLEGAIAQKRRPNTAINKKINK